MAFLFQSANAAFAAAEDGIFIALADLANVLGPQIAATEDLVAREGIVIGSFVSKLASYFAGLPTMPPGWSFTRESLSGGGAENTFVQGLSFRGSRLNNEDTGTIAPIPDAMTGLNAGLATFGLTAIFPGAVKVAAAANTPGAGVLIFSSRLTAFTSETHATFELVNDSRELLLAILNSMALDGTRRGATVASAMISSNRGSLASTAVPASWYAATNPLTGLAASDAFKLSALSRNVSFSVEYSWSPITGVTSFRTAQSV